MVSSCGLRPSGASKLSHIGRIVRHNQPRAEFGEANWKLVFSMSRLAKKEVFEHCIIDMHLIQKQNDVAADEVRTRVDLSSRGL